MRDLPPPLSLCPRQPAPSPPSPAARLLPPACRPWALTPSLGHLCPVSPLFILQGAPAKHFNQEPRAPEPPWHRQLLPIAQPACSIKAGASSGHGAPGQPSSCSCSPLHAGPEVFTPPSCPPAQNTSIFHGSEHADLPAGPTSSPPHRLLPTRQPQGPCYNTAELLPNALWLPSLPSNPKALQVYTALWMGLCLYPGLSELTSHLSPACSWPQGPATDPSVWPSPLLGDCPGSAPQISGASPAEGG